MNKKVAVITFCLGNVPYWIDYFLKSCSSNDMVDWLFFTDHPVKGEYESNVNIINTSLDKLSKLISEKIDLQINIKHPYKLCEFRPAFGVIFSDYLQDYDYWGYCDNDLIFGDIFFFLGDAFNKDYHIISPHNKFVHGHLCLLKNTSEINNIFRLSSDYKDIFSSEKLHVFDESFYKKGINLDSDQIINSQILRRINKYMSYKKKINIISKIKFWNSISEAFRSKGDCHLSDFNQIINYLEKEKKIRTYRKSLYECDIMKEVRNKGYWKMTWRNGKLVNEELKELLYFHFQLSKYKNRLTISDNIDKDNSFVFESAKR